MSLLLLTAKKKFSPLSWFSKGEQGAWYDPSDLTTLFQDSAGTTPVTLSPMEQPVGLMLDKSKGLALGAELVANGTFTTGTTGWSAGFDTASSTFTASGGVVSFTKVAPDIYPRFMTPLTGCVVGNSYKVTWTNVFNPGGDLRLIATNVSDGTGGVGLTNAAVLNQWVFVATATTMYFGFNHVGITGTTWQIDNISVKQIAGNHAFQATPGNRPLLSARVNLLTKTEAISVANGYIIDANSTLNINAGIAPNGTLTASKFNSTSNTNTNQFYYTTPQGQVAGVSYTFSHYLKLGTGGTGSIRLTCGGIINTFNLLTGTVVSGVGKITPVGDGWFFCSVDGAAGNIAVDNIGTFYYWARTLCLGS